MNFLGHVVFMDSYIICISVKHTIVDLETVHGGLKTVHVDLWTIDRIHIQTHTSNKHLIASHTDVMHKRHKLKL